MQIIVKPVAFVRNSRTEPTDDFWGSIVSEIELANDVPTEAFKNIDAFSHLEVIFYFDKVNPMDVAFAAHLRGNKDYPEMGIFALRKKDRPNSIGLCTVELISHNGRTITVKNLDAIDGSPVLDIKPVMAEFEPKSEIKQPALTRNLMKEYWL
jgi:tRNA-Thr(GGU) m(6)t(6)A37 methyltransferase TsaA